MSHIILTQIILNHLQPTLTPVDVQIVFRPFLFGSDRCLVDIRQARALAHLDTSEFDDEIARRIMANTNEWH